MHPLDQFRAFQAMREKGMTEEAIAAAFFVDAKVGERFERPNDVLYRRTFGIAMTDTLGEMAYVPERRAHFRSFRRFVSGIFPDLLPSTGSSSQSPISYFTRRSRT